MSDRHIAAARAAFERHGTRTRTQVVNAGSSNFAFSVMVLTGELELVRLERGALVYGLVGAR